jgi:phenylpropionate dioxygenase-like ring-hydroxylating dioxygenase large terminal subunit
MLSHADNEMLTRTGPGTPMGQFMRAHWFPFMLSEELVRDAPPKKIALLGEKLVAFRDSEGRAGLVAELCPHRRASLYYGRNEEGGLRCVYHGWKFDVEGRCVDMPSQPVGCPLQAKVRLGAYPCVEHAGLLWTSMGADRSAAPPAALPELPWTTVPGNYRYTSRWLQDCNWAQALEGEIDEAHVGFLHARWDSTARSLSKHSLFGGYFAEDPRPDYSVAVTGYGLACAARRRVEGRHLWRINLFLAPFYTLIPPSDDPHSFIGRAWIPADDEHCWVICVTWRDDRPPSPDELAPWRNGEVAHRRVIAGTTTPLERAENDYLIDREQQRTQSCTGVSGIRAQDALVTESCGAIVDRSLEHLGPSDRAVIAFRRWTLRQAKRTAAGEHPTTATARSAYRVQAVQFWADDDRSFEALPDAKPALGDAEPALAADAPQAARR